MADPNHQAEPGAKKPTSGAEAAHAGAHDDMHAQGHEQPGFAIIEENSSADGFLNFAAWLGFVGLLIFSFIMLMGEPSETNAASQAPPSPVAR